MKLWIIKIGKACSALKNEGVISGGKRVLKSFFALFHKVESADVLIITGGLGDSARYRATHVAEELRLNSVSASTTVQDNPFLSQYAKKFVVFVFHRVLYTSSVKKLIDDIKRHNKIIIFETDDLVFDKKYLEHMDMWKNMNVFERRQYENGVGGEILADAYVKHCSTSTTYLAEILQKRGKKVFIVQNKLSIEDVKIAEEVLKQRKQSNKKDVAIGYFSGTKSHDKDFATVAGVLAKIMQKHQNVKLFLAGPLNVGKNLEEYENRIERIPYVERDKHFANIASVDINIAPLEIGNPFCESKSELKFFEAGIVGVPTVAAATQTFCEAIEDGKDGFVASTTDEWYEKLEKLITDSNLRQKMGSATKKTTERRYVTKKGEHNEYLSFLKQKIEDNHRKE
ncbi:MAG: glycosyltransferase [Candidatus Moranbacteria bacterium]|nr:glycosyltransferase [Candidatus Moranbacteria bacterium]